MKKKQNNIFDASYVDPTCTIVVASDRKSPIKEFLKAPISEADLKKYGTSKPYRSFIRAVIQNGKS